MLRISSATAFFLTLCVMPGLDAQNAEKLFFPACAPFTNDYTFDCYHDYAEVESFLREGVRLFPQYARLESIGKSYQGRDLWVITITDFNVGTPDDKPGIWVDGGVDADEVIATEAALGLVHRLLTSNDAEVTELRRTRTFYIAPVVMPDASQLQHTTPERPRDTTFRPWDDDGDGSFDEDGPEDLDGDGQALQMRRVDPTGDVVIDEVDVRLMRARRPGDAGPFYRTYLEGIDNDGDGQYQEDRIGGVDPNRNYPGNWSIEQRGSGPYAGSEPGVRAMLDFIVARPNIAASQHFHSSGGVVLRPPSVPDFDMPPSDYQLYLDVSRRGLEVTGYGLATSVYDWNWPQGARNTRNGQVWRDPEGDVQGWPRNEDAYPAFGGSIDGLYLLSGVLAFAVEIYQMGEDLDGDGRVEPAEQLRYDDDHLDGAVFKEWADFDHPQLGAIEIGGWRKFGQNNPIGDDLPREVERTVDFALMQGTLTPLLRILEPTSEDLGGGVFRISASIHNAGYQPTELAIRSRGNRAVPVRVRLEATEGVELFSDDAELSVGTLEGHASEEVSWIVRGADGDTVTVVAHHPKAGIVEAEVRLGG